MFGRIILSNGNISGKINSYAVFKTSKPKWIIPNLMDVGHNITFDCDGDIIQLFNLNDGVSLDNKLYGPYKVSYRRNFDNGLAKVYATTTNGKLNISSIHVHALNDLTFMQSLDTFLSSIEVKHNIVIESYSSYLSREKSDKYKQVEFDTHLIRYHNRETEYYELKDQRLIEYSDSDYTNVIGSIPDMYNTYRPSRVKYCGEMFKRMNYEDYAPVTFFLYKARYNRVSAIQRSLSELKPDTEYCKLKKTSKSMSDIDEI